MISPSASAVNLDIFSSEVVNTGRQLIYTVQECSIQELSISSEGEHHLVPNEIDLEVLGRSGPSQANGPEPLLLHLAQQYPLALGMGK